MRQINWQLRFGVLAALVGAMVLMLLVGVRTQNEAWALGGTWMMIPTFLWGRHVFRDRRTFRDECVREQARWHQRRRLEWRSR